MPDLEFLTCQAQVKSTVRPNVIPFSLLVRDVSTQLDTLHENKKFAEKETASIQHNQKKSSDQRFKVTLPKHETYFPLFKYTCTGDLRPVPIVRVQ